MAKLYFDATQPLRWGPHPPVGIPRVESALIRQVLRRKDLNVGFYLVEGSGRGRILTDSELRYLEALVERRVPYIEGIGNPSFAARLRTVYRVIQASGGTASRELDRAAAGYLARRTDRQGMNFRLAKLGIRMGKLLIKPHRRKDRASHDVDPLSDPAAYCFLSNIGLHTLAGHRSAKLRANVSVILHDTIPLDMPQYVNKGHATNFARDFWWMVGACAQLVCVSEYSARTTRKAIESETSTDHRPVIAVNPLGSFLLEGLEGRALEPVASLAGQSFAVYCSTIEIRKNHITLLRAWQRLMPLLGDDLPQLVICGRWGWMVEEVKEYLAAHPELDSKVSFLSGISDPQLAWLYKNARFGLFPSHAEGWGLGAAECLDFGLPVLISGAPALAEATQDLMPVIAADDLDGWCAAIERASTDDAWLETLRASIAERHRPTSEAEFAGRLLDLIQAEAAATGGEPSRSAAATSPDICDDRVAAAPSI